MIIKKTTTTLLTPEQTWLANWMHHAIVNKTPLGTYARRVAVPVPGKRPKGGRPPKGVTIRVVGPGFPTIYACEAETDLL